MHDALLLTAAVVCAVAGMGWLALAMDVHWEQVRGAAAPSPAQAMRLRALGSLGLLGALGLCLAVDHASMASLMWVMALAFAALAVGLALAWRPRWLRVLAWAGGAR
jgi:hypothetical protein